MEGRRRRWRVVRGGCRPPLVTKERHRGGRARLGRRRAGGGAAGRCRYGAGGTDHPWGGAGVWARSTRSHRGWRSGQSSADVETPGCRVRVRAGRHRDGGRRGVRRRKRGPGGVSAAHRARDGARGLGEAPTSRHKVRRFAVRTAAGHSDDGGRAGRRRRGGGGGEGEEEREERRREKGQSASLGAPFALVTARGGQRRRPLWSRGCEAD